MKIVIGSDHGGWRLKDRLGKVLEKLGHEVTDVGTTSPESVDYPDYGARVARDVAEGRAERGVAVCTTGIGMSMVANKVPGIRAALCHDVRTARASRAHNDANVLALGGDVVSEEMAEKILSAWLDTPFDGGRHERRVNKIRTMERAGEQGPDS